MRKLIIIGAGASGMAAGIAARRNNVDTLILEKNERAGKKLLITGNGSCNLTNLNAAKTRYFGQHAGFVKPVFKEYDSRRIMEFFEELGISCVEKSEGKIFPRSLQASSVLDVLREELQRLNCDFISNAPVVSVRRWKKGFAVITADGQELTSENLIIAAGGKSAPNTGSSGDGFELAKSLGHHIIKPLPSLAPAKLDDDCLKGTQGVRFTGKLSLIDETGKSLFEDTGDVLFTDYGVSGPVVMDLSAYLAPREDKKLKSLIRINFVPDIEKEEIIQILKKRAAARPEKTAEAFLNGFINKRLIPFVLKKSGLIEKKKLPVKNLAEKELLKIAAVLHASDLNVKGVMGYKNSAATLGGVDTAEIDPLTMESKLVNGLYFAGEVIDIMGRCGGYNLQFAWASGLIAGESIK